MIYGTPHAHDPVMATARNYKAAIDIVLSHNARRSAVVVGA